MNELEIKILNINIEKIKSKLECLDAKFIMNTIQKIYTYDCYEPLIMYKLFINEYKITKSKTALKKIINLIEQIIPIINNNDKNTFKKYCNYENLNEYITNNINNIDINILENKEIIKVIDSTKNRFFKWARLRQSNDKVELTVKYIYSTAVEYNIDQVKEIEIIVNDFDNANNILEELGYFRKKLVEKKRTSYKLEDANIEIDEWPLIPPYIEIESDNVDTIYSIAEKLGYSKNETRIMNTEDVYIENGLDLTSYEVLTFERSEKNNE